MSADQQEPRGTAALPPDAYAADLLRRAEAMYAEARSRSEALAATRGTAVQGDVRVDLAAGGVLAAFEVASGAQVNPVRLTRDAGLAHAAGLHALTETVAGLSGGLDDTVRAYAPPPATDDEPPGGSVEVSTPPVESPAPLPADAAFDDLLAVLDDTPDDLERFVAHPEFQRHRPAGDPPTWQRDHETHVEAISAHADELAEAARALVGTHETGELTVEVGTSGNLVRLVFKDAVRRVAPERIGPLVMEAYAVARAAAAEQLAEATRALGYDPDPDHIRQEER